jgi:hypothetical protein
MYKGWRTIRVLVELPVRGLTDTEATYMVRDAMDAFQARKRTGNEYVIGRPRVKSLAKVMANKHARKKVIMHGT